MMKKYLYMLFTALAIHNGKAQVNVKDRCIELTEQFKQTFNQQKDEAFYKLLSKDFQKQLTLKDYIGFTNDIRSQFGELKTSAWLRAENGGHVFKNEHKNSTLLFNIVCNDKGLIDGLQMQPLTEKKVEPRNNYATDNLKTDSLGLLIDKVVTDYMRTPANCGLSIAVFKNNETTFYNYGETARDTKQLPNSKSIYEIGSITKVFTGLLLAKAIEDKKVKLEDDIRLYLPSTCKKLMAGNQIITLQHLVTHTSGIPSVPDDMFTGKFDSLNPYIHYNKERIIRFLSKLSITEKPGKKMEYSNLGMGLLGIILADVYKQTYEALVQSMIVTPLNLTTVKMSLNGNEQSQFVNGYNSDGESTPHWDLGDLCGAGGLRSTPKDMLQFMIANLNATLPFIKVAQQSLFQTERDNIGMAWVIQKTKARNTLVWHNGGTYGFSSFAGLVKEKNCAVVILSNSGNSVDAMALSILKYIQR